MQTMQLAVLRSRARVSCHRRRSCTASAWERLGCSFWSQLEDVSQFVAALQGHRGRFCHSLGSLSPTSRPAARMNSSFKALLRRTGAQACERQCARCSQHRNLAYLLEVRALTSLEGRVDSSTPLSVCERCSRRHRHQVPLLEQRRNQMNRGTQTFERCLQERARTPRLSGTQLRRQTVPPDLARSGGTVFTIAPTRF
jgi:hypothetical protein